MKKYLMPSLKITIVFLVICSILYPLFIGAIGKLAKGRGNAETVEVNGKVVGYANIGQKFTEDKYFWGRPSAVDYNAAGSAGSNKGPTNPDYLKTVQDRIDSFLVHNPSVKKEEIPSEMVTASGSGLDPDISPESANIQINRIATVRKISPDKIKSLIKTQTETHVFGPRTINVLRLNIALDNLK
jgi:K+-transporting ATPase ATPase C chain